MTKRFLKASVALAATASVLVLAGCPAPNPVVKPSASVSPTASAAVAPSVAPSASVAPSVVPTVEPSGSVVPTPGASVIPSAVQQIGNTSVRIYVKDDKDNFIDGATVTAELLVTGAGVFANGTSTDTVTASNGNAIFNAVPQGVQVKYTVTKTGYTTRALTYSAVTGGSGTSILNDLYFGGTLPASGGYGRTTYALSDSPEVTAIEPAYNSTGISPTASFKMTFSEDVNKSSVEDGFLIETNADQEAATSAAFSVGGAYGVMTANADGGKNGMDVYDKSSYDISWTGENQVTFAPKSGYPIPTDKDSNRVPQYRVTFKTAASPFKDKSGVYARAIAKLSLSAEDGPFRVTSTWKGMSPFTVVTDTTAPKVDSVYVTDATTIKVRFSEPMALYPLVSTAANKWYDDTPTGAGALFAGGTYKLNSSTDGNLYYLAGYPGAVVIDGSDATNKTIKLTWAGQAAIAEDAMIAWNSTTNILTTPDDGFAAAVGLAVGNIIDFDSDATGVIATKRGRITAINLVANPDEITLTDVETAQTALAATEKVRRSLINLTALVGQRLKVTATSLTDPAGNEITTDSDKSGSVVIPTL